MISALEMVGAMLLMNREQVLWSGRGLGESSLGFFSSFLSSSASSFGFSSSSLDGREQNVRITMSYEYWEHKTLCSLSEDKNHLHPPLPPHPCLPPLPSSQVYQSSWNLSLNQSQSHSLRRCLRRRCLHCASSFFSADE